MSYPITLVKLITPIALAISLAACGGGSFGDGQGKPTTTQSETVSSLGLIASSRQLLSDGSVPIIITAVAKNANNIVIPEAELEFSVDNGATLTLNTSKKGEALLTPGTAGIRTVNVSVSSGSQTKSVEVDIVGTYISIEGPSSMALNSPTAYTFKLRDGADNAVAFTNISLSTDLGNIEPSQGTTNGSGEFVAQLQSTVGGTATIKADALGASSSYIINISSNDLTVTGTDLNGDGQINEDDKELALDQTEVITVKWLVDGVPQVGKTINFRTTRGTLSQQSDITDGNGQISFILSPANKAGEARITAETTNGFSAVLEREFVATVPKYISAQVSPSFIAPLTSSTVSTRVWDNDNNPVKNVQVNFNLIDTVGGSISESQSVTDSLGRAEVIYTAGDIASSLEDVKITTTLQQYPSITDEVSITVGGSAARISLGTDGKIAKDGVFYVKTYGVVVTDSAGQPVENQKVDFTIAATHYNKGYMLAGAENWVARITTTCSAEDFNHNAKLDDGEDINNNTVLDPTQAATVTGNGITDEQGKLTVDVVYPISEAYWSTQRLTATVKVTGTEVVEHSTFVLEGAASDFGDVDTAPVNAVLYNEDRNRDGNIDTISEDANNNNQLDVGEDIFLNNQLDTSISEDLDGNGFLDVRYKGSYGYAADCTNPN